MNQYQQGFQTNVFETIVKLIKETWEKIGITYIGYYMILIVVGIVFGGAAFAMGSFEGLEFSDFTDTQRFIELISEGALGGTGLVGIVAIAMIPIALIATWYQIMTFSIIDTKIKTGRIDLRQSLEESKNIGEVFRILGASIGLYIMVIIALIIVFFIGNILSPVLGGFLVFFALFPTIKLALVIPAMILGKKSFADAISFSLEQITMVRGLKIIALGFALSMGFGMLSAITSGITAIFSSIFVLSILVSIISQVATGILSTVLFTIAMTGLYYRYAPAIGGMEAEPVIDLGDDILDDF